MTTLKDIYVLEPTPLPVVEEKPLPCRDLSGVIDSEGNIQLLWEHDNPEYKVVTFKIDIEGVRTLTSLEKNVFYSEVDRTADGLTPPLEVTVWAISAMGVLSDPYTAVVTPVLIPDILTPESGVKGFTIITGNYTVQESDNFKVIIGVATNPDTEYIITFPPTLSNGFLCYVVNSLEGNASGNRRSYFTIQGTTFLTRTHNDRIKAGESRLFVHVSNGRYFTLGKNEHIYDYVSIGANGVAFVNQMYEITAGNITINLPTNPVDGAFVGFKVASTVDIKNTPVTLTGSGKTIEGNTNYIFNKPDERIVFFYTGTDWIYTSRSYYVDPNAISEVPRMTSATVNGAYTIQESDYKKWIKANGTFIITVPASLSTNFECIIQNIGTGTITIDGIVNRVGNKLTTQWTACHIYYDGSNWTSVGALTL